MNIAYLFQDAYPWDVRVEKICRSLAEAGHRVHIVSRNRHGLPRREELAGGLWVARLPFVRFGPLNALLNFPAFFSPVWLLVLWRLCRREQVDLVVVRDLPLAPLGLLVARLLGIRVVLDMAENYPAMLADTWTYGRIGLADRIIRNPTLWRQVERWVLPRFDRVLVVSPSSGQRIASQGVAPARITVVGNTPVLEQAAAIDPTVVERVRQLSDFILVYVGGMEETRGLETVVRALPKIRQFRPDVRFVVGGRGTSEAALRQLAMDLDVADNLVLLGWVDPRDVPAVITGADVGVIPHFVTEHTQTTIPNKIYDYMGCGKPVLVSAARSLMDIVEQHGCGLSFRGGDSEDFAGQVHVLTDLQRREELGRAGQDAVRQQCNWLRDAAVLCRALQEECDGQA